MAQTNKIKFKEMKPNYKTRMQNFFESCNFPREYSLKKDEINGKTFCIAKENEEGVKVIMTNFFTPQEMSAYLFGRYDALTNKLK